MQQAQCKLAGVSGGPCSPCRSLFDTKITPGSARPKQRAAFVSGFEPGWPPRRLLHASPAPPEGPRSRAPRDAENQAPAGTPVRGGAGRGGANPNPNPGPGGPRGATPRTPATDGRLRVPGRPGASPGGGSAQWRLAQSPGVSLLALLASPGGAPRADALQSPGFKVLASLLRMPRLHPLYASAAVSLAG
jgi:hypothetical protein